MTSIRPNTPTKTHLYATLTVLITAGVLFALYLPGVFKTDALLLSLFSLLYLFASQVSFRLSTGTPLSPSFPVGAAALYLLGPGPAILSALPGLLTRWVRTGRPTRELLWSIARITVTTAAAGWVLSWLGGRGVRFHLPDDLVTFAAICITYDLTATVLTAIHRSVKGREPLWQGVLSGLRQRLTGLPFMYGSSLIITLLSLEWGWFGVLLSTLPIIAVHRVLTLSAEVKRHQAMAVTDSLTGAYNQRYFWQWLSSEGITLEKGRAPVAFLVIDLDRFKMLNDNFGHQAGDEALRTTAAILREWTRRCDLVIRYGGDEFVVVLPGADPEQAELICDRIEEALGTAEVEVAPNRSVPLRASLGLACFPQDGDSLTTLFTQADAAMYARKQRRRFRRFE